MTGENKTSRIHPALPTRDEVNADSTLFYSDHIPHLLSIPIENTEPLSVITYNVYGSPAPCGYDLSKIYKDDEIYKGIERQLILKKEEVTVIPHLNSGFCRSRPY